MLICDGISRLIYTNKPFRLWLLQEVGEGRGNLGVKWGKKKLDVYVGM